MVSWATVNPQSKLHLDRFNRFRRARGRDQHTDTCKHRHTARLIRRQGMRRNSPHLLAAMRANNTLQDGLSSECEIQRIFAARLSVHLMLHERTFAHLILYCGIACDHNQRSHTTACALRINDIITQQKRTLYLQINFTSVHPHLIYGCLGPGESSPITAYRSDQSGAQHTYTAT